MNKGFFGKIKEQDWPLSGTIVVCFITIVYVVFIVLNTLSWNSTFSSDYIQDNKAVAVADNLRGQIGEMGVWYPTLLSKDNRDDLDALLLMLNSRKDNQQAQLFQLNSYQTLHRGTLSRLEHEFTQLWDAWFLALEDNQNPSELSTVLLYFREHVDVLSGKVDATLAEIILTTEHNIADAGRHSSRLGGMILWGSILTGVLVCGLTIFIYENNRRKSISIRHRDILFESAARNIDNVIYIFNREKNQVEYISGNCRRMLGLTQKEILAKNDVGFFYDYVDKESGERLRNLFADGYLHTNARANIKYIGQGRFIDMKVEIYPVRDEKNLYIAVISDETDTMNQQKILMDALENSEKASTIKRKFFSRMSHEIRSPLMDIVDLTTLAKDHLGIRKYELVKEYLGDIHIFSRHLLSLVNEVMDMSKIEEGQMTIERKNFDTKEMIESLMKQVYPGTHEKNLSLDSTVHDLDYEMLVGDPGRINQVLYNLLSNAIKFTPNYGKIRLDIYQRRVKNGKVFLQFVISDNGIGITPEFMSHLFQPFEQDEQGEGDGGCHGTGLGLAIAKSLVTMMDGIISAESTVDKGSKFTVELPLTVAEVGSLNPKLDLSTLSALIIDDDVESSKHMALILNNMGLPTDYVLGGEDGVKRLTLACEEGLPYDLCFIDWHMPQMSGEETCRQIRQIAGTDLSIVILSNYDLSPVEQLAKEAGATAFIPKPIFASTLYNALLTLTYQRREKAIMPEKGRYNFKGKKVLLAEDNDINIEIAMELLTLAGVEVELALDGKEALYMFDESKEGEYSLILMDIQMPNMNGYDASKAIRACGHPQANDIPIFALTANALADDVEAAYQAGMTGHISKPIDVNVLYATLEEYL